MRRHSYKSGSKACHRLPTVANHHSWDLSPLFSLAQRWALWLPGIRVGICYRPRVR